MQGHLVAMAVLQAVCFFAYAYLMVKAHRDADHAWNGREARLHHRLWWAYFVIVWVMVSQFAQSMQKLTE